MKCVISSTYDDKYLYFLPIVTFCWNKLDVGTVCFIPELNELESRIETFRRAKKFELIVKTISDNCNGENGFCTFKAPEHKEATYAQCSRLYGACLDLPEDEVLITGDVDMAVFKLPPMEQVHQLFSVFGIDLVLDKQLPICYQYATVKEWRKIFKLNGRTYQQCLDDLLSEIDCENMRGNYWSKDQQESFDRVTEGINRAALYTRARPNTQFADHRCDRDDVNWRAYVNEELIDAHLWRNGYTDENHANIMELMRMKFPDEDFTWLDNYRNAYKQLL